MTRIDGYLRPKDVAADLDVSYVSVMNYIKRGQLKAFKLGGQWRIAPSELERFKCKGNRGESNA
jgi:excisionase family DNA binding protein